jgi:hypothetical protein
VIGVLVFAAIVGGLCLALVGTALVSYGKHHGQTVRPSIHEPDSNVKPRIMRRPFDFDRDA